jgi:hypothetical protein
MDDEPKKEHVCLQRLGLKEVMRHQRNIPSCLFVIQSVLGVLDSAFDMGISLKDRPGGMPFASTHLVKRCQGLRTN